MLVISIFSFSHNGLNPFPNDKFHTRPNWKKFADNDFKFNEKDRKFSKQVENTVGKEEIACYKQFLFFPQCFQKTCTTATWKSGPVWERVKSLAVGVFQTQDLFGKCWNIAR